jgi:hypothetical protein
MGGSESEAMNQFTVRHLTLLTKYFTGDKANEAGGTRGTHGGEEKCIQNFGEET